MKAVSTAEPLGKGYEGKYILTFGFMYKFLNSDESYLKKEDYKEYVFLKTVMYNGYFDEANPDTMLTHGSSNYTLTGRMSSSSSFPTLEQAKQRYKIQ